MIYGIGHDVVENKRVAQLFNEHGQWFIDKILSPQEQDILQAKSNKAIYLAKRFAAKEAFAKACGCGLRSPILMPNITILNDAQGKPYFVLDDTINLWLSMRRIAHSHLSISDDELISSAFVVLEQQ